MWYFFQNQRRERASHPADAASEQSLRQSSQLRNSSSSASAEQVLKQVLTVEDIPHRFSDAESAPMPAPIPPVTLPDETINIAIESAMKDVSLEQGS